MNNKTVENAVERSDRWYQRDGRVELIALGGGRIGVGEPVASFPLENLTDENWETIKQLQEVEALSDEN